MIQTTKDSPCITEFGAYNDTTGDIFNDPTGAKAVSVQYK